MLYRPALKGRVWYQTKLCEHYGAGGLAAQLWARHLAPLPHFIPANDRDHLKW